MAAYITRQRRIEVEPYVLGMEDGFMEESELKIEAKQYILMSCYEKMQHGFRTFPYVESGGGKREFPFYGCYIIKDQDRKHVVNEKQLDLMAEPLKQWARAIR
jgi:hypothetical protein